MIEYKVGQEIYHTRFGRGIIQSISDDNPPIICVDFGEETKDLVYDKNLLLRMTIRGAKPTSNSTEENKTAIRYVCGRCEFTFIKNARCPECGQAVKE